jgi:hypothetical protein
MGRRVFPSRRLRAGEGREFCPFTAFDRVHVHPRNTKIRAKIGTAKDAQSKIRTAISRFVRRRAGVVPSALSVPGRILDRRFATFTGAQSPFEAVLLSCRVSVGGGREARPLFLRQT